MLDEIFAIGSVADKLLAGMKSIRQVPIDERYAFKRMLLLADEIDKMTSAINALEMRIQKLETAVNKTQGTKKKVNDIDYKNSL